MEDPSASHGFPKESIYALYVALMTLLFALVYPRYNQDLKRIQFALALFVINFIVEFLALMYTTTLYLHSVALRTVFCITMISAPAVLIHAFMRPRTPLNANNDDIPTDSIALVSVQQGEGTSSIPDTNNENDINSLLIATDSLPLTTVTEEAGTSNNSDSDSNYMVEIIKHQSQCYYHPDDSDDEKSLLGPKFRRRKAPPGMWE